MEIDTVALYVDCVSGAIVWALDTTDIQNSWTDLGERKWTTTRSLTVLRAELEARLSHYPNLCKATIHTCYFTRTKITHRQKPPATEHWHDLEDIYNV